MAPQYKLTYFNVMALAEPIRLLLVHAGVEFEDCRIEQDQWPKLKQKTPWNKLPVLEEGNFTLSQSVAILKYLGAMHGYAGSSLQDTAKCDEYLGVMVDFREAATKSYFAEDPAVKAELEKKFREEIAPATLRKLNRIIDGNGKYLVGDKLTYADFYTAHFIQQTEKTIPNLLDSFSGLKRHQNTVFSQPGIKEWVEKRPVTQW